MNWTVVFALEVVTLYREKAVAATALYLAASVILSVAGRAFR